MVRLSRERHERLKKLLMAEKMRLWTEVRRELFETLGQELRSQYDLPQDIGERSLIDVLADTELVVADTRRQELTRMEEAMGRLAEGSYGVCEECGVDIGEERLRAVPYATHCISCQTRQEGPHHGPGVTL